MDRQHRGDGLDQYLVCYQLANRIVAEPAWDSDTAAWTFSKVTDPNANVAVCMPLAATVGRHVQCR